MRIKKYSDIETGKIYQELSCSVYYDVREKEILIIREPSFEEENGIPTNNDYPYGQSEILELINNRKKEKEKTIVVLERVNVKRFQKNLNSLKTFE